MKKLSFLIVVLLCGFHASHGQLTSRVDPRFELTSIAARLAEYPEYSDCRIPAYAVDIDTWFAPHKEHPLIAFLKDVRRSHSISYNCISGAAYALDITDGKIALRQDYDLSRDTDLAAIDNRWDETTLG